MNYFHVILRILEHCVIAILFRFCLKLSWQFLIVFLRYAIKQNFWGTMDLVNCASKGLLRDMLGQFFKFFGVIGKRQTACITYGHSRFMLYLKAFCREVILL